MTLQIVFVCLLSKLSDLVARFLCLLSGLSSLLARFLRLLSKLSVLLAGKDLLVRFLHYHALYFIVSLTIKNRPFPKEGSA